jgi:cytochrome c-type biogenesis protein CcmF
MIVEFGHYALVLALAVALVQGIVPMVGAHKGWRPWMDMAIPAAHAQLALVGLSFAALTWAFLASDFSVSLVYANSHSEKPWIYKITGVWGNHEGSLLLWILILALFGSAAAAFGQGLPPTLRARVLGVQAWVGVAFLLFILLTSNPFLRLDVAPMDGRDLNPLLQDPGLALHPPFLYLGYVGLSMTFSFAVAALLEGRVDAAWGRWVRPWTLAAWLNLTAGIGLGSWWAYYELGWGGFWFWDPVENASFMPWLLATALLHSAIVVEKRESLKSWTILLAILAFCFCLLGTFIVRSGVITSVHAFAHDPTRGVFILLILAIFAGGALALYAWRAPILEAKGVFGVVSRESAIVLNNVLLSVAAFVILVGTVWPLFAEMLLGRTLSVGPPFFDAAFSPFMVALAVALPIGAMIAWKRGSLGRTIRPLVPAMILAFAFGALAWTVQTERSILAPVGLALAVWIMAGALTDLWLRTGRSGPARLLRLPGADWGKFVAHAGLGVTMLGVSLHLAWEVEDIRVAQFGEPFEVSGYSLTLDSVDHVEGPNYLSTMATLTITRDGRFEGIVQPEKRIYPIAGVPTTEAGIDNGVFRDVYVVLGDPQADGGWAVRTYVHPFANWIWGGTILMAFGALLSLGDRRLRVAAGAQRPERGATSAVPAE